MRWDSPGVSDCHAVIFSIAFTARPYLCCVSVFGAICFFYPQELFLLKRSALNFCTELLWANWPWRTWRQCHILERDCESVGCVYGKRAYVFSFLSYWCTEISVAKDISSNCVCLLFSVFHFLHLTLGVSVGLLQLQMHHPVLVHQPLFLKQSYFYCRLEADRAMLRKPWIPPWG